jgi:hypothetical protein
MDDTCTAAALLYVAKYITMITVYENIKVMAV